MKRLLKKLNKVLGGKMFLLFLFTFIFVITTVLGNIGDSGYSGIQVENYFSGSGKQGINQNISFNDTENNSYSFLFEDGLLVNYTKVEPPQPPQFPSEGLIAYYKLDEGSGGAEDSYGSNDGTNNGATINQAGKINTAYYFESGDYIHLNDNISYIAGNGQFTFNLWYKASSLNTTMTLIDSGGGQASTTPVAAMINIPNSGDRYRIYYADDHYYDVSSTLNVGEWKMITLTGDGINFTLYENGTEIDQSSNDHILNTSLNTYFSRNMHYNEWWFNGLIDEVGIWNRALNSTEVATLYNNGTGLTYSA